MPRRRKGIAYEPDISVLLRNAQPTQRERLNILARLLGKPDACEQRDLALDRLIKIYRDPKELRKLNRVDRARVRIFLELLKDQDRKRRLPKVKKAKGGRPTDEHRGVLIAAHAREAVLELGEKHGNKTKAFNKVAKRGRASYDYVKELYYRAFGEDHDPDFREAVDLALSDRNLPLSNRKEG